MMVAYGSLVVMALLPIFIGSYRSVSSHRLVFIGSYGSLVVMALLPIFIGSYCSVSSHRLVFIDSYPSVSSHRLGFPQVIQFFHGSAHPPVKK